MNNLKDLWAKLLETIIAVRKNKAHIKRLDERFGRYKAKVNRLDKRVERLERK